MSIEKRQLASGGAVYDVTVYQEVRAANGRRRKICRTAPTLKEARALEHRLAVESEAGGVRDSRRTVADLLEAWLKAGEGTWSAKVAYDYRKLIDREIRKPLGGIRLDRLGVRHLDKVYADMRAKGLSGTTIRNTNAILRAALNRAVKWQWIPANPALQATPGPVGGNAGRVATQNEVEAVLGASGGLLRLAVRLAATTGMRRSELAALRWEDIDFERSQLTISRATVMVAGTAVQKGTKTHAVRLLDIDAGTMELLKAHRGIAGPVLGGMTPNTMSKRLAALTAELGIEHLGWHSFRHYVGTMLIGRTDLKTLSDRLGHSTPTTTLHHYVHGVAQRSKEAADAMGELLG